ncbi:MAG: undecaprenyl-diphosphatase UppP [Candidatus Edwardsbacteria bacterium]|nr:undecaprenyl-diphosphatase UppP [Candidatus Edwardsbacteria bacterium]
MIGEYLQAAILGAVQGLTEFVPVSSSGHLVVVRELFHLPDQGLAFDAVLHLATALAVLIYFWADWESMITNFFTRRQVREAKQARKLLSLIIVTTVPAIGAGLLWAGYLEAQLRNITIVASLMILTGLFFILIERISKPHRDLNKLTFFDALSIGLAQALAILPGISRSGATIMTGMYHGLKRDTAARYAFLAAGPIVVLAGFYSLWQLFSAPVSNIEIVELAIGFITSLLVGLVAIHFLLSWLKQNRLYIFAGYLILAGAGLIIFRLF